MHHCDFITSTNGKSKSMHTSLGPGLPPVSRVWDWWVRQQRWLWRIPRQERRPDYYVRRTPGSHTPSHSLSIDSLNFPCNHPLPSYSPSHSPMELFTRTSPFPKTSHSQFAVNPPKFIAPIGVIPNTEGLTWLHWTSFNFFYEHVIELIFIETRRYANQYLL